MADVANQDAEIPQKDAESGPKGLFKRLFKVLRKKLIIGALAVIVCAGAAAMYLLDPLDLFGLEKFTAAKNETPPPDPVFYELPEITVNLVSSGGRTTYLKLDVVLEISSRSMISQMKPYMPRVLDAFQVYLRELRIADIEGSAGLFRLKEELQRRINIAIYPAKIEGVLFRNILVQ